MITDEAIEALKLAAGVATPGPWIIYDNSHIAHEEIGHVASLETMKDAPFISQANPQTILALIERLEAAERDAISPEKIADAIFKCGDEARMFGGAVHRIEFKGGTYPDNEIPMGGLNKSALTGVIRTAIAAEQGNKHE